MSTRGPLDPFLKPVDPFLADGKRRRKISPWERRWFFKTLLEKESQPKIDERVAIITLNDLTAKGFIDKFLAATITPIEKTNLVTQGINTRELQEGPAYCSLVYLQTYKAMPYGEAMREQFRFEIRSSDSQKKYSKYSDEDSSWAGFADIWQDNSVRGGSSLHGKARALHEEFETFGETDTQLGSGGEWVSVTTFPLTRRNLSQAMQHFKRFFENLLKDDAKMRLGKGQRKAQLKIYYPEVDETELPTLIGNTRRNYERGLESAFEDPLLGYGVDPGQVPAIIERRIRKRRLYFPDEDIEEALERARKRQRPDEAAALLLRRNGGDVEAAAQMLAKLRFY
jgi:hypothetical protein